MYIHKSGLTIRNANPEDAEQLSRWWNDGKVMAHAGFPNGTGETPEMIGESLRHDSDDGCRRLIIEIDDVPAGEMVYRNMGDGVAEIGTKICDFSKQEKGYGRVLLSMLIGSLFDELGYRKIILDTNTENKRAQHIYELLGFRKIRINVDAWENQLGELQSSVDYELIPSDFINFAR